MDVALRKHSKKKKKNPATGILLLYYECFNSNSIKIIGLALLSVLEGEKGTERKIWNSFNF